MGGVQPGAGVRDGVHHRVSGGTAGREPEQGSDAAGEGHVPSHHQNGGRALLLVSLDLGWGSVTVQSRYLVLFIETQPISINLIKKIKQTCFLLLGAEKLLHILSLFVKQDHSLLSVGGQPGGDPEDAVGERTPERPAQVDPESPELRDG